MDPFIHGKLHGPASMWEHQKKKLKVMTESIVYKIYREILFQKVASGIVLHFLYQGSSKNLFKQYFPHKNTEHRRIGKQTK